MNPWSDICHQRSRARKYKTITVVDVEEESCSKFDDAFKSDCLSCCTCSSSGDDLEDSDLEDNLENDFDDDC